MKNKRIKVFSRVMFIILTMVSFVFAFSVVDHNCSYAATSYPVIKNEGLKATLNKKYTFKSPNWSSDYSGNTTKYAYIYKKGKKVAKFKLPLSRRMTCIGKYKGKFYFNVEDGLSGIGVYSYKLGDKKFRLVQKNNNLEAFSKKYKKSEYDKKHSGLINKRYVIARKRYPTDGYAGYGEAYVFDLKSNKKVYLGSVRDVIIVGKKIYWTTTKPYDWLNSYNPKIIVRSASCSGKNIKTIKTIPFGDLNAGYGGGTIDKHYVTWNLVVENDYGETESVTIKRRYRSN